MTRLKSSSFDDWMIPSLKISRGFEANFDNPVTNQEHRIKERSQGTGSSRLCGHYRWASRGHGSGGPRSLHH